jgi:ferredoxin
VNDAIASKRFSWPATIALSALMAAFLWFFIVQMAGSAAPFAMVTALGLLALYSLILKTGEVSKWRRVFFVFIALAFAPSFIAMLIEDRGSMMLGAAEVFKNETPFCHIVLPMTILPYLATGELIFPAKIDSHFASVYAMLSIWLIATLTVGRGWCSWVCFYGGWDDGFSRVAKKPRLQVKDPEKRVRYFNFVVLAFVVLASLGTLTAVYCAWLCPFKAITEYAEPENVANYLAMLIFVALFVGLAIVLPILTKKRAQCMSFCPFGAFQSMVDKISPYRVRIDRSKCVDCGACVRACPTMSLDEASVKAGKTLITCTKCGECFAACPKGAIDYRFAWAKGCGTGAGGVKALETRVRAAIERRGGKGAGSLKAAAGALSVIDELFSARALMTFSGFLIGSIIGGSFATGTLLRLWNLVTAGSFLLK